MWFPLVPFVVNSLAVCSVKMMLLTCSSKCKDTHHTKFVTHPLDVLIPSYKTPLLEIPSMLFIAFPLVLSVLRDGRTK
jgi:hypothetical protein